MGHADLHLDSAFLDEASKKWQMRELLLRLDTAKHRQASISGRVKMEVIFEPTVVLTDVAQGTLATANLMLNSPSALRLMGIGFVGISCPLMFVASQAKWISCSISLERCRTLQEVPGAPEAAVLAALAAFYNSITHLFGLAGLLGAAWRNRAVVGVTEVTHNAAGPEEESCGHGLEELRRCNDRSIINMQVQSSGMLRWDASVSSPCFCCPRVSLIPFRLLTWFAHFVAGTLISLAILLAWLQDQTAAEDEACSCRLGESTYIMLYALFCVVAAARCFYREQELQEDTWESFLSVSHGPRFSFAQGAFFESPTDPGGSLDDVEVQNLQRKPRNGLEDIAATALARLQSLGHEAELLAKPLIDARHRIQERIDAAIQAQSPGAHTPEWMQPLLEAFHQSADSHQMARASSGGALHDMSRGQRRGTHNVSLHIEAERAAEPSPDGGVETLPTWPTNMRGDSPRVLESSPRESSAGCWSCSG